MIIDTHSHLYLEQFNDDIEDVVSRAKNAGVQKILLPNIDTTSIDAMLQLVNTYPDMMFPMMGLHPTSVKEDYKEQLEVIKKHLAKEKYVAIGEIGIDLYWDKTFQKQQIEALHIQLQLSQTYNLPVVIHMRESFDLIKKEMIQYPIGSLKGVFHCFTGNKKEAEWIIDRGFYLGIGGVLTFKNSDLSKQITDVPLSKLLLETDAPYLSPMPFRGKRNESAYLIHTAKKMADCMGKSESDIFKITTDNAKALFKI